MRALSLSKTARRGDEMEHWIAKHTGFSVRKRIRLYQRLYRFTSSNISVGKALEMIWARYNRARDPRRTVFRRMIESNMNAGRSVADSMAAYIPAAERLLIFAGEEANKIASGFKQSIFVAGAVREMRKALTGALMYPLVLFVMLSAMLVGMALKFVPVMLQMAPLSQWPTISLITYYVGMGVKSYGAWILGGLIVGVIVAVRTLPVWVGKTRAWCDRFVPPWTIYRQYTSAIFLISLSALTDAGRPIETAVNQLAVIAGPWMRNHLNTMHQRIIEGENPGRALNTGWLDKETCGDLEDYSAAGTLDSALAQIGKDTVEDAIDKIKGSAMVIRFLMMALVAVAIIIIYVGMVALVLQVAQKARR